MEQKNPILEHFKFRRGALIQLFSLFAAVFCLRLEGGCCRCSRP
jgi:hypothetical protein